MPSVHPKRQRIDSALVTRPATQDSKPTHSRILAPFRAIGHVSSAVPFGLLPLGRTFQITTALEHTVQTYDIRKLHLLFVSSPPTPGVITRVVAHKAVVYAAFTGQKVGVWIFKRGKKVGDLQEPMQKWGAWKDLIVFGDWIVGAFDRALVVWRKETGEVYTEIEMSGKSGGLTAVCHPSAYLNKLVVTRRNGDLEIWNVKTSRKIYTILAPVPSTPTSSKAITTIVQSPVISVVAIGYSTGEIHLHNVHTDTPLFTLNQTLLTAPSQTRRVTSISFCTDPFVGAQKTDQEEGGGRILAVGHDDGFVTLWNLEKRRVFGDIRNAHDPSPLGINVQWLPGQNVLVTSSADNSIKEWVFDSPHTTRPRLLRSRGGHHDAISSLTFASPTTSHFLLSASRDQSLRAQSLRNDSQSFEFSQGVSVKKATKATKRAIEEVGNSIAESKAGPITAIATCAGEDGAGSTGREWEGIVTAHQGEQAARSWSFQNKKIGRWQLETSDGGEAKSVAITACGTFALVGSSKGGIAMYNLQSGILRRRFPEPLTPAQAKLVKKGEAVGKLTMIGKGKHTKAITGIVTDSLNRVVITSGLDGRIKFWEFTTGILIHEFDWEGTTKIPNKMKLNRPSELLAVSCDDTCIRVIDMETKKIVRELWGCEGKISDFCFSSDGRWIVAASMDSVIRIWDLPTGHLIDGVKTKSIVTALAFAGPGEYLATAHVGSVGINLWTNRTLFRHVPTRRVTDADIVTLGLPTTSGEGGTSIVDAALKITATEEPEEIGVYTTADQLSESLLTMSLVPRTRWQTLLNLDLIRARNKPKEAPKVPEKAPFFLPSLEKGAANTSVVAGNAAATEKDLEEAAAALRAERDRILRLDPAILNSAGESMFTRLLRDGPADEAVAHLKSLPPSSADLEIRGLRLEEGEMVRFVEALTRRLQSRRDFELVQTWMNVFLRCHGEVIIGDDRGEVRSALEEWKTVQSGELGRLADRVGFCLGVAEFLRSGR